MLLLTLGFLILFTDFQDFADYTLLRILPILMFCIVLFKELLVRKNFLSTFSRFKWLWALGITVIVGILTTERLDVSLQFRIFKLLTFLIFVTAFFSVLSSKKPENSFFEIFFRIVYIPILLFVSLNLGLFFLGLKETGYNIGDALILSSFGFSIERTQFLLSPGINAYGAFLGILMNLSLVGFGIIKKHKKIFLIGFSVSLISLLLTDSRGPIVYTIIIFLLIYLFYSKSDNPRFLYVIPFIGFIGPLLMLFVLTFIADLGFAETFSRSSGDLATGNSRSLIWAIAFNEFNSFEIDHLFGYGEYGHFAAGLSQEWAFIFGNMEDAEYTHPHNTLLSIALDYGYFGIFLFVAIQILIIRAIKLNWIKDRSMGILLLSNLLYFNLVGIGETMFGFYYQNILYIFFMINSFAFLLKYSTSNTLDNQGTESTFSFSKIPQEDLQTKDVSPVYHR